MIKKSMITLGLSSFTLVSMMPITACAKEKERPNVIFILADDLGYNDLGCYGSVNVRTPNIDALADQGLRFTSFRTAASISSPSRAAILTGAYPQRCGLYMGINPQREPHWFLGLDPSEITVAEQFKKQDYSTLIVGKWHLGTEVMFSPLNHGFDDYYGMPSNWGHSPKFYDGRKLVYEETPLEELTSLYTDKIIAFIKENAQRPFFLYYSHNYPHAHTPIKAGKRFQGSSDDGMRGDVIQEFDWSVGEILETLKVEGILSNTIIVFTSDNGPLKSQYADPFRGGKFNTLEGGHRVPLIIYWEDGITGGRVLDNPVHAMDFFPTFSEIIGEYLPGDRIYDGLSMLSLFKGGNLSRDAETPFYYYNAENLQAILYKNWKLHLPRSAEQIPLWSNIRRDEFTGIDHPVLYDIAEDT